MLRPIALLGSLVALSFVSSARAQTAEDIAAARALGVQGVRLADDGKCAEAMEKLERAEALFHAPTILGRLGECQVETGRIVLGTENLNRVVREQLAPNAPAAFKTAQERARKVLDQALPRIAYLTVKIEPQVPNVNVTVDGKPVPAALIGAERPTDPGSHEVLAAAPGHYDSKAQITLSEGAHQELSLTLTANPSAEAPPLPPAEPKAEQPAATPLAPAPPHEARTDSRTGAYVALGVGGAGLLVGSISGVLAISKKGSLDCPNNKCPPDQHSDLDQTKTFALVSTVGFGVGIAGAAIGTVLLLTGSKSEPSPSAQLGSVRGRPWIADRWLGIEGDF